MTETRLCRCGCELPIIQRANEKPVRFRLRKFATRECAVRGRMKTLEPRYCEVCNKLLERRRYTSGAQESPKDYLKRKYCSREHQAEGLRGQKRAVKPVKTRKRLCRCGCGEKLTPRPNETNWQFKQRRFASNACTYRHRTVNPESKPCGSCGKPMTRKRFADGTLEGVSRFKTRVYCSRSCQGYGRTGKPRSTKAVVKPATATQKPPRAAAKPKAAPKPRQAPSKPSQAITERVFTGLPDPRRNQWATIAPARVEDCCPLHPSEHAGRCTSCLIASTPHRTLARPFDTTAVWRRS